jgi:prepilin-type N-terminal cleavage/methylation domain-containing protein
MRKHKHAGFTLVELMVAMALTLFIMVILSQAFVTALETFAGMKGIGDMQQNLRTAGNILKSDLSEDHFEGKRRLSDFAGGSPLLVTQPAQAGFFTVVQQSAMGSANYIDEGEDTYSVPGVRSYRATDHVLYLTVKRKGNRLENFFSASLQGSPADLGTFFGKATAYDVDPRFQLPYVTYTQPYFPGSGAAFYSSQWAEVIYYLKRTGSTEEPNNPNSSLGTPTYGLYRAQFVMVPDATNVTGIYSTTGLELTTFKALSCDKSNANPLLINFFSPADAASFVAGQTPVVKRVVPVVSNFTPQAASLNNVTARVEINSDPSVSSSGSDALLLPSVISFQVQVMPTTDAGLGSNFVDVRSLPGSNGVYDTANFGQAGFPSTGLRAIQITLRVWDPASRQARQMTIVQDL